MKTKIRMLKRNDRTRVRQKGMNPFFVKDSDSPYGSGLPIRIWTRTLTDPDYPFGFGLGLPVRIWTARSAALGGRERR
ncbi:hypothetical protein AVEN_46991-1 [Araneus ventricosus]|uniref:Uncharacterized protein n=1 Tax=Araneus ventricosus TaxID=182803 RepID=A0A4Y2IKJ4_ARAVE|nr:hypothetical protein AVEN_46991-1 [Araneus ventricosus]